MRAFFSQFGTITRLRLSRNKKARAPCPLPHSLPPLTYRPAYFKWPLFHLITLSPCSLPLCQTAASKHYAFVEFESADVAAIAAEAMDNYLMFGHVLQVRTVSCGRTSLERVRGRDLASESDKAMPQAVPPLSPPPSPPSPYRALLLCFFPRSPGARGPREQGAPLHL